MLCLVLFVDPFTAKHRQIIRRKKNKKNKNAFPARPVCFGTGHPVGFAGPLSRPELISGLSLLVGSGQEAVFPHQPLM